MRREELLVARLTKSADRSAWSLRKYLALGIQTTDKAFGRWLPRQFDSPTFPFPEHWLRRGPHPGLVSVICGT